MSHRTCYGRSVCSGILSFAGLLFYAHPASADSYVAEQGCNWTPEPNRTCFNSYCQGTCKAKLISGQSPNAIVNCACETAGGGGDPHLFTLDGLLYDFQAAGEFLLATDGPSFTIQVRQEPARYRASYITALATRVGAARVAFYAKKGPHVRVDGEPFILGMAPKQLNVIGAPEAWCAPDVTAGLPGGGWIRRECERYTLGWPDGQHQIVIDFHAEWLDVHFAGDWLQGAHLAGLLGDGDGDPRNDLRTREGRIIEQPPTYEAFYGELTESWRIRQAESLFDYDPGQNTETFTDRTFPSDVYDLADLDPNERADAEQTCRLAGVIHEEVLDACTLDVATMMDPDAAALFIDMPKPLATTRVIRRTPIMEPFTAESEQCSLGGAGPGRSNGEESWLVVAGLAVTAMYRRRHESARASTKRPE